MNTKSRCKTKHLNNSNEKQNRIFARLIEVAILLILVAELVVLGVLLYKEGFSRIRPLGEDKEYLVREEELVPREDLTSFYVADDKIYLFYDKAGIVNTYSLDGEFQYGIQFKSGSNSIGDISYLNECLLIKSRQNVMFFFDDKTLVNVFAYTEDKNYFSRLETYMKVVGKNHTSDTDTYYYWESTNQIVKRNINEELSVIIDMPKKNDFVNLIKIMIFVTLVGYGKYYEVARVWLVNKTGSSGSFEKDNEI